MNIVADVLEDQQHNQIQICFVCLKTPKYCTYHIHYSEDIWFHMVTSMIFNHFTVCNHKCLHPSLLADRAPRNPPDSCMILFPSLSLLLLLFEKAVGIWKSKKQCCLEHILKLELHSCNTFRMVLTGSDSSGCHPPDPLQGQLQSDTRLLRALSSEVLNLLRWVKHTSKS